MKKIVLTIFTSLVLQIVFSQDKQFNVSETDTLVFIDFNATDLGTQKRFRLDEARKQNRISDAWDLKQFYPVDPKWFKRYMDKLNKELKKGKINHKFISRPYDLAGRSLPLQLILKFKSLKMESIS